MDREKVIAALHCRAYDDDFPCGICAYYRQDEKPVARCDYQGLIDDAITLLKEQDAMEPKWASGIKGGADALCGSCMAWLSDHSWGYCPRCGRKVLWDA